MQLFPQETDDTATGGRDLLRSDDAGATWTSVRTGLLDESDACGREGRAGVDHGSGGGTALDLAAVGATVHDHDQTDEKNRAAL